MNETTREMVFENETEKEEFLKKEYPFDVPKMNDKRLMGGGMILRIARKLLK